MNESLECNTALHILDITQVVQSQLLLTNSPSTDKERLFISDQELAFKLYSEELDSSLQYLNDSRIAHALGLEGDQNGMEAYSMMDSTLVDTILSTGQSPPSPLPLRRTSPSLQAPVQAPVQCAVCLEQIPKSSTIQVPCPEKHYYDVNCLKDLFIRSTVDEELFPPRCDRVLIPFALIKPHLSNSEIQLYNSKANEYQTPNRLYCSRSGCSNFLGSTSKVKGGVRCSKCNHETCRACKAPWHGLLRACSTSDDSEVSESLIKEFKYQKYPQCGAVASLILGCNHIVCRCSHEYCYECGDSWKRCSCPLAHEERLLIDPIDEDVKPVLEVLPLLPRRAPPHDHDWKITKGGRCGFCYQRFKRDKRYTFLCDDCGTRICVPCQRNRLR